MFSFLNRDNSHAAAAADIGWLIDPEWEAGFIWDAPRKLSRPEARTNHSKGVSICPAINDHEARLVELVSPIDIHLRLGRSPRIYAAQAAVFNVVVDGKNPKRGHVGQRQAVGFMRRDTSGPT